MNKRQGGNKMEGFIYMACMIDDKLMWTFNCHYSDYKMTISHLIQT
jgi:hypothetical protein